MTNREKYSTGTSTRIAEILLNIVFVPLYFFWQFFRFCCLLIWKFLVDVARGVYGNLVKLFAGIAFLAIIGQFVFWLR